MRTRSTVALACLGVALLFARAPGEARAQIEGDPVAQPDEARLSAGETVSYPKTVYRQGRRYIGGVAYAVVDASVDELTGLLADMSAYTAVLPHARAAKVVGTSGGDQLVEISQALAFLRADYTLRMRTDPDHRRVRFWLDRSRPHAIDDAWGYFRVEPLASSADGSPRVLLTYGILVDLGPGLMRDLFEARIQASMLAVPDRLRRYTATRFRSPGASRKDRASVHRGTVLR